MAKASQFTATNMSFNFPCPNRHLFHDIFWIGQQFVFGKKIQKMKQCVLCQKVQKPANFVKA